MERAILHQRVHDHSLEHSLGVQIIIPVGHCGWLQGVHTGSPYILLSPAGLKIGCEPVHFMHRCCVLHSCSAGYC